ncbi:hypothetical protein F2Q69_00052907 [Brassica cretica]|uniref:Uncharacterized protein n=1 Tax=Brassica cretica TaxID=69181 RepID=A0A8S9MYQ4_BRACR|nr:hypothetical protein F2Q69_00052907 [Brassica cretica]
METGSDARSVAIWRPVQMLDRSSYSDRFVCLSGCSLEHVFGQLVLALVLLEVVKEEKLQEGDFELSSMSFRSSHRYRPTQREEHRPMESDEHRSIPAAQHRSTIHTEPVASCETIRIMTHEEFTAKHPYPPKPFPVTTRDIDRHPEPAADRQRDSTDDR